MPVRPAPVALDGASDVEFSLSAYKTCCGRDDSILPTGLQASGRGQALGCCSVFKRRDKRSDEGRKVGKIDGLDRARMRLDEHTAQILRLLP